MIRPRTFTLFRHVDDFARPAATQKVGPFVRMPELMAEFGIDPEPVFRGLSFGPKALADCDGWRHALSDGRFWRVPAGRSETPPGPGLSKP